LIYRVTLWRILQLLWHQISSYANNQGLLSKENQGNLGENQNNPEREKHQPFNVEGCNNRGFTRGDSGVGKQG
jgi:hypothetical protein